jgi:hypothetical protein
LSIFSGTLLSGDKKARDAAPSFRRAVSAILRFDPLFHAENSFGHAHLYVNIDDRTTC